jgi:protease II
MGSLLVFSVEQRRSTSLPVFAGAARMRQAGEVSEPQAPMRPTPLTHRGDTRVDDWYWLREKDNPEVIELLEAENAYTAAYLSGTEEFQQELFEEF